MDIRGRMGTRYEDYLTAGLPTSAPLIEGHSSYYSKPDVGLDPNLFNGETFRPDVRTRILGLLYGYWKTRYRDPRAWSTVWVAGSGASYQWSADRGGIGDLDVLIGVDYPKFFQSNAEYRNIPRAQLAAHFDTQLHDDLWPETAHYVFGNKAYEVTFYVNETTDITDIVPYAAYNLTTNSWTVRPIVLPEDWSPASLPADWRRKFAADEALGRHLVDRYYSQAGLLRTMTVNSPQWVNAKRALDVAGNQAKDFFDEIHLGRHDAFSVGGEGFRGFGNARWQSAKNSGIVDALREIKRDSANARFKADRQTYGENDFAATSALVKAALWGNNRTGKLGA